MVSTTYTEDWKRAILKMNNAVFEVGMGLSRLSILVFWMAMSAAKEVLIWGLAFLLTGLALLWNIITERYWRVRAAVKEFRDQLWGCGNDKERFLYLTS
jgi:hypothetical protein